MYGIEEINHMNKKAEDRARKNRSKLFVAQTNGDVNIRTAPYIGDYIPEGWRQTETFFVDSSGMGGQNEPALTFNQLIAEVKKGYGYALISVGQFQVYIAEFRRL